MVKKLSFIIVAIISFFTITNSTFAEPFSDSVVLVSKKKDNKAQAPVAPREPNYRLTEIPLVNYTLITESDWRKVEQYFADFEQYAEDADRELAKIKKLKKEKKRPKPPRMSLNNVATNDLPLLLRNSPEKYLSLGNNDRRVLESNLSEIREYITEVQRLFNSN
jgi:hypothetical protein